MLKCRTREAQNSRVLELARSLGKPGYAGSDAHFVRSICRAVVEVKESRLVTFVDSLRWTKRGVGLLRFALGVWGVAAHKGVENDAIRLSL